MARIEGPALANAPLQRTASTAAVRSVERAARILDALYRAPGGKTVTELSQELGLPRKTIRRLLHTLVTARVVEPEPSGQRYQRNPSLWLDMACDIPALESTSDTIRSVLTDLERETGLHASIAAPDHELRMMSLADWYLLRSALGLKPRTKTYVPMHATAVGLAYLASLPQHELRKLIPAKLHQFTPNTIGSRKRLEQELALVRQRGYAVCQGTFVADSAAVAVPVAGAPGRTIAAISLGAPIELLTEGLIQDCLPAMRRASQRLSRLAYPQPQAEPGEAQGARGSTPQPGPAAQPSSSRGPRKPQGQERTVRSVERCLRIIHALWHSAEARTLADLSGHLGLHKTTVLRILRTLESVGVVHRDERGDRYICSPTLWLGLTHGSGVSPTARTVRSIMQDTADAANMLVWLATADAQARTTTVVATALPQSWVSPGPGTLANPLHDMIRGRASLLARSPAEAHGLLELVTKLERAGRFYAAERRGDPLHASAAGKLYLASLPEAHLREWMPSELPRITEHTITSRDALIAELQRVREQGYAVSREEAVPGVFSLGVPVRGARGRTIASVGVAAPPKYVSDSMIFRLVHVLRTGAGQIADLLRSRAP